MGNVIINITAYVTLGGSKETFIFMSHINVCMYEPIICLL